MKNIVIATALLILLAGCREIIERADGSDPGAIQFRLVVDRGSPGAVEFPMKTGTDLLPTGSAALLDGADIRSAEVQQDRDYGGYRVLLSMTPAGKEKLRTVTRDNLEKKLAVIVGGKVEIAPIIKSEIWNGKVMITGRFGYEEAEVLARSITGRQGDR